MRLAFVLAMFAVSVAAATSNMPTEDTVESSPDLNKRACPCDCVSLSCRPVLPRDRLFPSDGRLKGYHTKAYLLSAEKPSLWRKLQQGWLWYIRLCGVRQLLQIRRVSLEPASVHDCGLVICCMRWIEVALKRGWCPIKAPPQNRT